MKTLMETIITIWIFSIALCTTLIAQEEKTFVKDSYYYVDLGSPLKFPYPIFGVGYRLQSDKHGFNTNLKSEFTYFNTCLLLGIHYFHYFMPDIDKQFYIGIGPSFGAMFNRVKFYAHSISCYSSISSQLTFGKSYRSDTGAKRFFEASISFPSITNRRQIHGYVLQSNHCLHKKICLVPKVVLQYGWGF